MRRRAAMGGLSLCFFAGLLQTAAAAVPDIPPEARVRGREIVAFEAEGRSHAAVDGEFYLVLDAPEAVQRMRAEPPFDRYGTVDIRRIDRGLPGIVQCRVGFPAGQDMAGLLAELRANPHVRHAFPNAPVVLQAIPDDPSFPLQWSLRNDGSTDGKPDADIDAPEAWEGTKGNSSISVFVIDSGIDMKDGKLNHPELDDAGRIEPYENTVLPGEDPVDDHGHGTHVAGIVGAETDNGEGIAGVCPACSLKIIKIISNIPFVGSATDAAEGITSAILYALYHDKKVVVNGSWILGGDDAQNGNAGFAQLLTLAHENQNILFVFAAGNYDTDCADEERPVLYPAAYSAAYDNVMAVAASNEQDEAACWSAYGPEITVAAPGEHIYSTTPFDPLPFLNWTAPPPEPKYAWNSGTSMAAPHVAGLAGLLWSHAPDAAPAEILSAITGGAEKVGSRPYHLGRNPWLGYGRINACASLAAMGAVPADSCEQFGLQAGLLPRPRTVKAGFQQTLVYLPYLAPLALIGLLRAAGRRSGKAATGRGRGC